MNFSYVLVPFLAWLVSGSLKFIVNSLKEGRWAFGLIGYGGLPSTHSAIVSGMASLIALREGIDHPAFGVSLTLALVVIMDARSLRRQVGKQAQAINRLAGDAQTPLRERMGHTGLEIAAGMLVGLGTAAAVHQWPWV
jgi:uncharacterized protein